MGKTGFRLKDCRNDGIYRGTEQTRFPVEGGGIVFLEGIKKCGGLILFLLLMTACGGDVGGSGACGGAEVTGSCLRIEKIEPGDTKNTKTTDVDAFATACATTTPTGLSDFNEPFTAHTAVLSFSNTPMSAEVLETDRSDITLGGFTLEYTLNRCPEGLDCSSFGVLTPLSSQLAQTVRVKADGTVVTAVFPFVPLSTKAEFATKGGPSGTLEGTIPVARYPSYTATYTISGSDAWGNPVSVKGSSEFTMGNFNNCSG